MKTEYRIEFMGLSKNTPLFGVYKYVNGSYIKTIITCENAVTCHEIVKRIIAGEATYIVETKTAKIIS